MAKKSAPPPGPIPASLLYGSRYNDEVFWKGFRASAGAHAASLILMILVSLTLSREPVKFVPSIRVDLVALPDVKKSEMKKTELEDLDKKLSEAGRAAKEIRKNVPAEAAKPKTAEEKSDTDMALKREKAKSSKYDEKSLKSAIDRIKALAALEDDDKKPAQEQKAIAKGNQLSQGTSNTGPVAQDSDAFLGKLQSKVHDNWDLPVWLSNKGYEAAVVIFMDKQGYVTSMVMAKTSGNRQFDDYCMKTIRVSQPFGAPPDEVLQDGVTLGFPL